MLDFAKKNVGKIADFGLQFPFKYISKIKRKKGYWVHPERMSRPGSTNRTKTNLSLPALKRHWQ